MNPEKMVATTRHSVAVKNVDFDHCHLFWQSLFRSGEIELDIARGFHTIQLPNMAPVEIAYEWTDSHLRPRTARALRVRVLRGFAVNSVSDFGKISTKNHQFP